MTLSEVARSLFIETSRRYLLAGLHGSMAASMRPVPDIERHPGAGHGQDAARPSALRQQPQRVAGH